MERQQSQPVERQRLALCQIFLHQCFEVSCFLRLLFTIHQQSGWYLLHAFVIIARNQWLPPAGTTKMARHVAVQPFPTRTQQLQKASKLAADANHFRNCRSCSPLSNGSFSIMTWIAARCRQRPSVSGYLCFTTFWTACNEIRWHWHRWVGMSSSAPHRRAAWELECL